MSSEQRRGRGRNDLAIRPGERTGLLVSLLVFGCGSGELPDETGLIESRIFSQNTFTTGDWPGEATGGFVVRAWRGEGEDPTDLCADFAPDGLEAWECRLAALSGLFSVIDDRVSAPATAPLKILVRVPKPGDDVEAYVAPIGHFITQFALFMADRDGLPLDDAVDEARKRFRPFLIETRDPHASPSAPGLATDAERQAFLLEGLTRVAQRYYGDLPTFHKTRAVTTALGGMVRQHGEFRDVLITTASRDIEVSREFLRHDLAREIAQMGGEFDLSIDEARMLGLQINGQSGPLFGFTLAPKLP